MRAHALGLALFAASLPAQHEPDPGHSHQGGTFDEGPRQAATLMPGLSAEVHFPIAGLTAEAQRFFDQAITQQHGFWYFESERSFRQVAKLCPDCAMAYWGMAMANRDDRPRAAGFAANAVRRAHGLPREEQLWIDAWATYYGITDAQRGDLQGGDGKKADAAVAAIVAQNTDPKEDKAQKEKRERRLLKDLDTIVHEFPQDIEAKAFLAVHIWYAYEWGGGIPITSYCAVDALLDQVFAKAPHHPAHHYRIHLWDREDAARALASAAAIGASAPAIAHQWHMAGHIYDKLDRHAAAAWQQEASARADHAHMMRDRVMPFQIHNYGHNQEWLCRSLMCEGRVAEALALAENMAELPRHPQKNMPGHGGDIADYAEVRMARACEDFGLWQDAVRLCTDGHFAEGGEVASEAIRLELLGRGLYRLGRGDEAARVEAEAAALVARARAERAAAGDAAEDAARVAGKGRGDVDKARDEAARDRTDAVRAALDAVTALRGERLLATGDPKGAIAEFDRIQGFPKTLLADAKVAAQDLDGAIALLADECKAHPQRVPLLRRLVRAYALAGKPEHEAAAKDRRAELAAIEAGGDRRGADFGERPPLDSLGPVHWAPVAAPPLELPVVAGDGAFALQPGQPTLVVFYLGFGCLHCVEQLKALAPEAPAFAAMGVRVVAIGTDTLAKAAESLQTFAAEERFPFPLLADPELAAFHAWHCYDDFEGMPLHGTFLVDAEGRVRWQDISYEPFRDVAWLVGETRRLLRIGGGAGGDGAAPVPGQQDATLLRRLSWLTGTWVTEANGAVTEETWQPLCGSALMGSSQTVRGGVSVAFEQLRIAAADGKVAYFASPGGRPATAFALSRLGDGFVEFSNPQHDEPQVIRYERTGAGVTATVRQLDGSRAHAFAFHKKP